MKLPDEFCGQAKATIYLAINRIASPALQQYVDADVSGKLRERRSGVSFVDHVHLANAND